MKVVISLITIAVSLASMAQASDAIAPPGINESTRGTPAQVNSVPQETESTNQTNNNEADTSEKPLETKHTGAKGYTHGVEINHSENNVQYMEDTDRDGQIQEKSNDLDKVPELPKWKLGSW